MHTEELAIARKQRELQTLAAPIANKTKMELQHEHMQKNQRLIAGGGLLHGADCGGSRVVTMVSQPIKPGQSRGTASDTGWLLPHAMQLTQQQRRRKCGGHKNQRKKGGKLGRTRGKHRGQECTGGAERGLEGHGDHAIPELLVIVDKGPRDGRLSRRTHAGVVNQYRHGTNICGKPLGGRVAGQIADETAHDMT